MSIVQRARAFVQSLRKLAERSAWQWRRCPHCGDSLTRKHGSYTRRPWYLDGRRTVRVQRHLCLRCRHTYAEQSALLVRGGWYAREVRRCGIDHWQHLGTSLRRTAELLRSLLGRQERWQHWRPLDAPPPDHQQCHLAASTVQRWLDGAGRAAQQTVADQLVGVPSSEQVATDGLWARLRGGSTRVVLLLCDRASGLVYPPVVAVGEEAAANWAALFARAQAAGLELERLRGVASDGATGLASHLRRLPWVSHQRCVFHLWRLLGGALARQAAAAAEGLAEAAAQAVRQQTRRELAALVHAVLDAPSEAQAQRVLAHLAAHARGAELARLLGLHLEQALRHLCGYNQGLGRLSPEWCWRDFRLRLSRGRNHRSAARLERAALLWATYRNFTPRQLRSERTRHYRHPGLSPLAAAGVPPEPYSYLDALGV